MRARPSLFNTNFITNPERKRLIDDVVKTIEQLKKLPNNENKHYPILHLFASENAEILAYKTHLHRELTDINTMAMSTGRACYLSPPQREHTSNSSTVEETIAGQTLAKGGFC